MTLEEGLAAAAYCQEHRDTFRAIYRTALANLDAVDHTLDVVIDANQKLQHILQLALDAGRGVVH